MPNDQQQDLQLAATRLELKWAESQERLLQLQDEMRPLTEAGDGLREEARASVRELEQAREANRAAVRRLEFATGARQGVRAGAEELEAELAVLEGRRQVKGRRDQELSQQIAQLQGEIIALKKELSSADGELQAGCNVLSSANSKVPRL